MTHPKAKHAKEWLKSISSKTKPWFSNLVKSGINISKQIITMLALVIIPITLLIYLLTMPVSTQIQAELTVDRVSFRVATPVELKKSIKFHSATLTEFDDIRFTPNDLPLTNVGDLDTVHITGFEQDWPTVMIDTATPDPTHFGELHELKIAKGAEVELTIEADERLLNITINNAHTSPITPPAASLLHSGAFQVTTRGCQIAGMALPPSFPVTRLSEHEIPSIDITGQTNTLNLILSLADDQNVEILMDSQLATESQSSGYIVPKGISITELSLLRKEMVKGQAVVKTAVKKGEIRYPAYPGIKPVTFGNSNFVFFDQMQHFRIEKIAFDPNENGFKVTLNGLAKESVRSYPQGFPENVREYRLSYSDKIVKAGKFYKLMFEMLLWIIPIIIGVVGIVSITRIKLSDDDITKLAERLNKQTELPN